MKRSTPLKRTAMKRRMPVTMKKAEKIALFQCDVARCTKPIKYHGLCGKHAIDEADRLCSLYVRKRDKVCQMCGVEPAEQWCHIFGRSYWALRWNPENAVGGCKACHLRYTYKPLEWEDWAIARLGEETWQAMRMRAVRGGMPDTGIVISELRLLLEEVA